jgi:hypothetical protein
LSVFGTHTSLNLCYFVLDRVICPREQRIRKNRQISLLVICCFQIISDHHLFVPLLRVRVRFSNSNSNKELVNHARQDSDLRPTD